MKSILAATDRHRGVGEDAQTMYPHFVSALRALVADIAAARVGG